MENRKSNYDITRDRVEGEFPQYDQETVIAKFHLAHDGEYICLRFAARDYRISRKTGRIERDQSPVTVQYRHSTQGSHSRSSEMRVRTPAPWGGCHQCCTSPSSNCREAASSSSSRVRSVQK